MKFSFLVLAFLYTTAVFAQLKPGFDKVEFSEVLLINSKFSENPNINKLLPAPEKAKLIYKSPEVGLQNQWQLWKMDNNVAVIGVRGSTASAESWLANLFAVQIPAAGDLKITKDFVFKYKLADHKKATVHGGYVFSLAFLARDILPKIDSCYKNGIKDFVLSGHSQGGGIIYVLSAFLHHLQEDGKLPADIRFKVYTSASPKPGNIYFAYDYENVVKQGWSFHIINTEDWVPQMPFTVQTSVDLPDVNPTPMLYMAIKKQSFLKRIVLRSLYRKATAPSAKAVNRYQKYLGDFAGKRIKKFYPDFELPKYAESFDYVRTGQQVVLYPDSAYFTKFDYAKDKKQIMLHHSTVAYYYLLLNTKL